MGKYINILVERIKIALKTTKEYKINLYILILNYIFIFLTMFLFLEVYTSIIGKELMWSRLDFILYFLLTSGGISVLFIISLIGFKSFLLKGNLNNYLVRPINPYFMSNLTNMTGHNIILTVIYFILFFILSFYYEYMLLGYLFYLFGLIYFIIFWNFLRSFAFFYKDIRLIYRGVWDFNDTVVSYTPIFFSKTDFGSILFILPGSVYGFLTIEIMKGNFIYFFDYIYLILISFVFLIIGNYLLWHYGLKKYEAFG